MPTIPDILAGEILRHRLPGEAIADTASRAMFMFHPEHVAAAVAEAERRERWRIDR